MTEAITSGFVTILKKRKKTNLLLLGLRGKGADDSLIT